MSEENYSRVHIETKGDEIIHQNIDGDGHSLLAVAAKIIEIVAVASDVDICEILETLKEFAVKERGG